jgi:hypothetical protein
MFPGVDGFRWTFGHILFLSLFFAVGLTILATSIRAVIHTIRDFRSGRAPSMCWELEYAELPEGERRCRHELAGRVERRTCPNAFDCRACKEYSYIAPLPAHAVEDTCGLNYPADRLYHRGHAWMHAEEDGTYTIGLDDLAEHLIGRPDSAELPPPNASISANQPAWSLRKGKNIVRVRAPIDGTVVETGGPDRGWYLRVRSIEPANTRHLLRGDEIGGWVSRELERLQIELRTPGAAPALADGGILMPGLMDAMPSADWDSALAGTFLDS